MSRDTIRITGARQHNLQNINVEIPRGKLVVITGVSGSGKSSLAFNTLYAEGQRRYVESLSAYARQFLDQLEKPDVDFIEGLSPAIAIEQRASAPNPRSTIATATEIYDYLRILYASCGQPHDPKTGEEVNRSTTQDIVGEIEGLPEGTRVMLLAPLPSHETSDPKKLCERLTRQGFVRVRVNGTVHDLEEPITFKEKKNTIEIVVDRLAIREGIRTRLTDSLLIALRWSGDDVLFLIENKDTWDEKVFTTAYANPNTGFRMPELSPRHFSFNSHHGACRECQGLGRQMIGDPDLLVPDGSLSIDDGAVKSWWARNKKLKAGHDRQINALVKHYGVDSTIAFDRLPGEFRDALFHGTGETAIATGWKAGANTRSLAKPYEGLITQAHRLLETSDSETTRRNVRRFMNPQPCGKCQGQRLKPEILGVTLGKGDDALSIEGYTRLTTTEAFEWLDRLTLTKQQEQICGEVVREIRGRLSFLLDVGLGYLTLDRENGTLSGGESQRIRLATQIGSGLAGVLYVLDEPSIGLHQRDNMRLIETIRRLRDLGNTVIVVEHDEETIRAADYLIDLGPGAGPRGGHITAIGTPEEVFANKNSLTGSFCNGTASIAVPKNRIVPPPSPKGAESARQARRSCRYLESIDRQCVCHVRCPMTNLPGPCRILAMPSLISSTKVLNTVL